MKTIKRFLEECAANRLRRAERRRSLHGATVAAFRIGLNGCRW